VSPPDRLLPSTSPSPFIIITQPERWYPFYRPTEGGRLSWPRNCSKGVQPVPKAVYRSGCRDKHTLPLDHCDLHVGTRVWTTTACRPFLEQQYDRIERRLWSSVRPQRHDKVVQPVAGVVGRNDDGSVRPVVVLCPLELTVVARLHRHNTKVHSSWTKGRIADSSPLAAANTCRFVRPWPRGSLDPQESAPERDLSRFTRVQHTDTQTTLRATSLAKGRISCMACRQCGLALTLSSHSSLRFFVFRHTYSGLALAK